MDALGRSDANLLTSEGVLEFWLNDIKSSDSSINKLIYDCLENRIRERRQSKLVTLLIYLQNPKNAWNKKIFCRMLQRLKH